MDAHSRLLAVSRVAVPGVRATDASLTDARQALEYWSRRAAGLRWHQRGARREARLMIAAARARLVAAHLERWGLGPVARVVAPLLDTRGRSAAGHARRLAWMTARRTPVGRRLILGGGAIAAATVASVGLIAAFATHLIAL